LERGEQSFYLNCVPGWLIVETSELRLTFFEQSEVLISIKNIKEHWRMSVNVIAIPFPHSGEIKKIYF